jgi:hypothetical protein
MRTGIRKSTPPTGPAVLVGLLAAGAADWCLSPANIDEPAATFWFRFRSGLVGFSLSSPRGATGRSGRARWLFLPPRPANPLMLAGPRSACGAGFQAKGSTALWDGIGPVPDR